MCGITGILRTDGHPVAREVLSRFNEAQAHRGPDGAGLYLSGAIGLGHRRLAILDLESGAQPQSNEVGTLHITFNGEIYNYRELRRDLEQRGHRFRTKSDTEVIVEAYAEWGAECLRRLRGMFAFAIWDARKQELFLARDRFGIKPLCYFSSPRMFAFASEIRAFRDLDGFTSAVNLEAIDLFLHFQYIPAPISAYRDVRKLLPAHYLVVRADGSSVGPKRYWDVQFNPDRSVAEPEWIERLDAALRETVAAHLVSDVPFGAFLSGGVDSGTVVGHMSGVLSEPVRTFTIGFEDGAFDERADAAFAARRFGSKHREELLDAKALEVLPELVDHFGEPFGDSSAVCAWHLSRVARSDVKMVLSGDGGDEIFAGYDYFRKILLQHPQPSGAWEKARRGLGNGLREVGLRSALPSHRDTWYHRSPFFDEGRRKKLWQEPHRRLAGATKEWSHAQFDPVASADLLSQCQYVDIHNYLPYDNLAKMDIASMCHGLEVRVPLLDHVFMETVARIPPELRVRFAPSGDGQASDDSSAVTKYLLKRTAERLLPPEYLNRKKLGFSAPVAVWLSRVDPGDLKQRLLGGGSRIAEWFDAQEVAALVSEHAASQVNGDRLWSLLFLAEWTRQNPAIGLAA